MRSGYGTASRAALRLSTTITRRDPRRTEAQRLRDTA
jgi:hypothetical protein